MSWLARLARGAPAPVYPAVGPDCLDAVERLLTRPALMPCASPRQAALLLVAGDMPERAAEALDRVHDQIPRPRITLHWDGASDGVEQALLDRWREICDGAEGEPDRLPDEPPNEWRGKGDHGQGGEGMMGGVPYGRPMAMTGEDVRDGLQLDRYTMRVGPFAPMLAPGLVLEVTLQGDVIAALRVCAPPFRQTEAADAPPACAARMLRLLGLGAAADALLAGRRPWAAGLRGVVPGGIGRLGDGSDARDRLAAWLAGERTGDAAGLFHGLLGLEWSEAVLALASVTPSSLGAAAQAAAETEIA